MVRAKFAVAAKTETPTGFSVKLMPVTGGSKENEAFYKFTSGGEITLSTINPEAAAGLSVGKSYYVDFTETE